MNTESIPKQNQKYFVNIFDFVFSTFIKPLSNSRNNHRQELILNVVIFGSLLVFVLIDIFLFGSRVIKNNWEDSMDIFFLSFAVLYYGLLLFLSRKGFSLLVSYTLITICLFVAMYCAFRWGAQFPFVILCSVLAIIMSGVFVSTRASFVLSILIGITLIGVTYFQIIGVFTEDRNWRYEQVELQSPIQISSILLIISAISWLSNREVERSLYRARISEQALARERDFLETKVEERTKELKQTQREKIIELYRFAEFGKLSSGIFHDLMNPLQSVIAHIHQLDSSRQNISTVKNHLEKAAIASKRMGDFLNTIKKQIHISDTESFFYLNKELRDAVDILEYRARDAGVTLHIRESKELHMHGSSLKFHQIALNLISNAIDACRGNTADTSTIHILLTKRDKYALLRVTDSGCGVEESVRTRIFDPFFSTKQDGQGLGLSTTKDIVEKYFNGTITVESTPNRGASFSVMIPLTIKRDSDTIQSSKHLQREG